MLHFITDILSTPAILIGLVALLGLAIQKKSSSDVIKGTIKTILGFIVIGGGAGILVNAVTPMGVLMEQGFQLRGVIPNNEAIYATAMAKFGASTSLIMAFGMVANIFFARFSKFKYIFLTGHHTLYMACMIAIILNVAGFEGPSLVILGSITLGLIMVLFPAMAQPFMRKITGSDDVAFGHFSTVGYAASALVGKMVGKGSKSTEEMNLPKNLVFLRDSSISISLTMGIIYLILVLAAGSDFVTENLSNGQNPIVYAILTAIGFAAGVFVILQGVRLVLAEIVPAFSGISEKLVPNSKPALDCPIVFPYAPNAVLIGFLASFVGGLISMAIMGGLQLTLILPGVVPHFFTGATAGVFGNATGGRRGAIAGAFINGVIISFLTLWLLPVLGDFGFANTTFSDSDFAVTGIFLGYLAMIGKEAVIAGIAIVAALVLATNFTKSKEPEITQDNI
ncbi:MULTISPECIES: PTS ascorbate transporter subunit IIC [unclassified Photobacterium]|uniref:PTS ascorbate transporter subunit IIC n=1 Tax=unclassified Photobacterium TaxID=2628852 RepID=UPI001EDE4E69|nr:MULTISPECIES: PTS ascorbate transporter subunit IIC [unclassified Photobacterium]MCG3865311.1 PTS ascorbate transporter subunit IIC [Photobacterium sp. Ph6]MCG3876867.1 PTS ascorbate transporter subunit IIC [Photobacterium sp. Ph5]